MTELERVISELRQLVKEERLELSNGTQADEGSVKWALGILETAERGGVYDMFLIKGGH